jgi:glutamine cyclotransferase
MKGTRSAVSVASVLAILSFACVDATGPAGPGNQANGRLTIINDAATLATQVTYFDDSIPVDATGVGYPSAPAPAPGRSASMVSPAAGAGSLTLKLKTEVASPTVGGQVLQATSVSIVGSLAVVSYNMIGNPYLGAVDVIDINPGGQPTLTSRVVFQNADISAAFTSGTNVFVAEATGDTGFQSPAVFEVMQLVGNQLVLNGNLRRGLTSFAGTGVTASGTRAYATSGDNGALFVFDAATLTPLDTILLHDARWVTVAGGKIVVVQGTPGQISVFNEATLAPLGTFAFKGAGVAESKSTAALAGGKAFIAAGDSGVQVLSATTGTVVGSVPRPNPDSLGLSPSVVVTNAAAVDADLLFISNGEAGVYVAQGSQAFSATGPDVQQTITMLGKLRFANLQSANHVAYSADKKYLIVAAGLGGLKIVQVN